MSDKHYTHHDDSTHLELVLRRAKSWFEANGTFMIYGLAAVLAVAAAIVWARRQPPENAGISALWMDARAPEDYQNIADKYEGTELGNLARLKQADALLNSASGKMFTDRSAANLELDQAEAALKRLEDADSMDETVRERVLLGLARLTEVRCDGTEESVKAASDAWQAVLNQNQASIARDLVENRIAELKKPETASFYAWFHKLDPTPADDLNLPGFPSGPASTVPNVPSNLNPPKFELPTLEELGLDGGQESSGTGGAPSDDAGTQPAAETSEDSDPAADDKAPAVEDNSGTTPTDKPAAATEEPATEEPATEEPATEEPAIEEPAIEEPATEEPATEEPATEEPATGEPATGEPAEPEPAAGE